MASLWSALVSVLPSSLILTAVASRRLKAQWSLLRAKAKLHADLSSGVDLVPIAEELQRAVSHIVPRRLPDYPHATPGQLRLLRAIVATEQLDFDTAQAMLALPSGHPAKQWVRARLALLRGETTIIEPRRTRMAQSLLGPALLDDTHALLALARGEPARGLHEHPHALPTTRARLLAALGREDEAVLLLRPLAASRVDALCRAFPADPATLAWLRDRQADGPYR